MGSNQQFLAARHAELVEEASQMMADSCGTNAETVGYVFA